MSTFNLLIALWSVAALLACLYLIFKNAPYGRHIKDGWGPKISTKAGWVFMESPCVILMIIFALLMKDQLTIVHNVFLTIWLTHYIHRTFIYPFWMNMTTKTMPLTIPISAFMFNIVNVLIQAIGIYYFTEYSANWHQSLEFKLGLIVFIAGMFINIYSDFLITRMKKNKGPGYHIPNSFLHKYISSPNYFGEIIEWLGWAILTWSASGLVFFIWTFANLFPRAISNHTWYKNRFEEYPKNRKAIFPGII